jgi:hypothetical protein
MSWHPKLADHEDVHRSAKRPRDFVGNWDAAPRKSKHCQIASVGEVCQLMREDGSSVSSIGKTVTAPRIVMGAAMSAPVQ